MVSSLRLCATKDTGLEDWTARHKLDVLDRRAATLNHQLPYLTVVCSTAVFEKRTVIFAPLQCHYWHSCAVVTTIAVVFVSTPVWSIPF